jgi:hypothetical protein
MIPSSRRHHPKDRDLDLHRCDGLNRIDGKAKLCLCLIKYHAMKTYGGVEVWLEEFSTRQYITSEWSASRLSIYVNTT